MSRRAIPLFLAVASVLLLATAFGARAHRPVPMPAPASADSLAGVLARLFPGTDSAAVKRIRWYRSSETVLGWAEGSEYAYRGEWRKQVPVVAEANLWKFAITLAQGANATGLIKHELAHLIVPGGLPGHDPRIFTRLESYTGR